MPASPLSPTFLPTTIATVAVFVPPVAAIVGRRSVREPAGELAVAWGIVGAIGVASMMRFYGIGVPRGFPLHAFSIAFVPALMTPPTLAWIGPRAMRLRWLSVLVSVVVAGLLVALLGTSRELAAIGDPIVFSIMCVITGLALAARVRTAPVALTEHDWFWILTGQLVYFAVDMFRQPLQEVLVARHWDLGMSVNDGIMLLFTASYLLVARGMLLSPARSLRPARLTRPHALTDSSVA